MITQSTTLGMLVITWIKHKNIIAFLHFRQIKLANLSGWITVQLYHELIKSKDYKFKDDNIYKSYFEILTMLTEPQPNNFMVYKWYPFGLYFSSVNYRNVPIRSALPNKVSPSESANCHGIVAPHKIEAPGASNMNLIEFIHTCTVKNGMCCSKSQWWPPKPVSLVLACLTLYVLNF